MNEERMKVLEMLANGRISVEQAQQLFEVMGVDDAPSANRDEAASNERAINVRVQVTKEDDEPQERMFGSFTFSQALAMGTQGTSPEDIARVRAAGLTDLSFEDMLKITTLGIDPGFIVNAQRTNPELSFDQIVHLGVLGISPATVQQIRESGLDDLSFDEVVQIAVVGVDPAFLTNLRAMEQV